jgi:undecaprenyl-diphosphatase
MPKEMFTKLDSTGGEPPAPESAEPESPAPPVTVSPRRAAKRAYWAEVTFAVALGVYAIMAVLAHVYAYFGWDLNLARSIQSISLPGFRMAMAGLSALGSGWLSVAIVGGAGLALVAARFGIEGVICMVGVGMGGAINRLLKAISGRPRPSDALVQVASEFRHESFPSGHVVFFVEFFGFLLFLSYVLLKRGPLRRVLIAAFGLLIALIGVSRVYLGAHWPSDVVGAYLAGGLWLMVMIEIYRRYKSRQRAEV